MTCPGGLSTLLLMKGRRRSVEASGNERGIFLVSDLLLFTGKLRWQLARCHVLVGKQNLNAARPQISHRGYCELEELVLVAPKT